MIITWKTSVPGSGYERFTREGWVDTNMEEISSAMFSEIMVWSPSKELLPRVRQSSN